ncbi:hypothetical protein [Psychromonas ossibalaenae]|uniref:hypothetical protein n=1 Tax=Psychromonas ossibalaenae TaxID=444922 RepID=UPI00036E2DD0|nr:hypothetical protein [Psychromonas ossibalaenae]
MIKIKKQQGAVLFFVLITLPMLVVLGLMLVENSSVDLKMVDARVVRNDSNIRLTSAASALLTSIKTPSLFANAENGEGISEPVPLDVSNVVTVKSEVNCMRRKDANGDDFQCRYLEVKFTHQFGREKKDSSRWGSNSMAIGVEQPHIAH